jgi:phosphoribosyl-ATP pyrophosphohydrolase
MTAKSRRSYIDQPELDQVVNSDEMGVRLYYERLLRTKEKAVEDLQETVYENYTEFVVISKEIANILYHCVILLCACILNVLCTVRIRDAPPT